MIAATRVGYSIINSEAILSTSDDVNMITGQVGQLFDGQLHREVSVN